MENIKLVIWGREFNLRIAFDCYSGETATENQQQALARFVQTTSTIDSSLTYVFEYCKKYDSNIQTDNVFRYVIPQALFIQRTRDGSRVVALMGAFKLDLEHGIAIVFKDEAYWKIGSQDVVL